MRYSDPSRKSKDIIEEMRKNPNKRKDDNKFLAKAAAVIAATTVVSGLSYAYLQDKFTGNDIPKQAHVEIMDQNEVSAPVFSKFKKDNMDNFHIVQKDLLEYKNLHNTYKSSDDQKAIIAEKMKESIEKINNNSELIELLVLNTVKSKFADAYQLSSYNNLIIDPDVLEGRFSVKRTDLDYAVPPIYSSSFSNDMQIVKTIEKLAKLQNTSPESEFRKTQKANLLYELYNSTVKTAKSNYLVRDGKLVEMDLNKSMKRENNKTFSYDEGR